MSVENFIGRIRRREGAFYDLLYRAGKRAFKISLPPLPLISFVLFHLRWTLLFFKGQLLRVFYYRQIFSQIVSDYGKNLKLSDVPFIMNDGEIRIGDDVSIGRHNSWFVGIKCEGKDKAVLSIGSNVSINYGTYISVAREVSIGNHVLIAERVMIFDNNSHPIDSQRRCQSLPISNEDVAPVIIEDYAWIGATSLIMKGVTVGQGSVVAAGSVVTHDVPPFTMVGGNPARILKKVT